MVEIIPVINSTSWEDVISKIRKVESCANWVHIDVTDGVFSKHPTWHNPEDLNNLKTPLAVEVHLMIVAPKRTLNKWLILPVKRVIVHQEAVTDMEFIIQKCHEKGIELGLAVNPETP